MYILFHAYRIVSSILKNLTWGITVLDRYDAYMRHSLTGKHLVLLLVWVKVEDLSSLFHTNNAI